MQRALDLLYPPQCSLCDARVETHGAFCGRCRGALTEILGTICDCCGTPLPGAATSTRELCDQCLTDPPDWDRGRAAWRYEGAAKHFMQLLKHKDRTDLAPVAALWMARAGRDLLGPESVLVPVPLHWSRLFGRRYNQSVLIGQALSRKVGCVHLADALTRPRRTPALQNSSSEARAARMARAIVPHPVRGGALVGRDVVVLDDVLTTGSTLNSAARACRKAGARRVDVLVLARVEKTP